MEVTADRTTGRRIALRLANAAPPLFDAKVERTFSPGVGCGFSITFEDGRTYFVTVSPS